MEDLDYWLPKEQKSIDLLLNKIGESDLRIIKPWFLIPENLKMEVGEENYRFIRTSWQLGTETSNLSYNLITIIFKFIFFHWDENNFSEFIPKELNYLLSRYGDWWEKPIFKKWFESKTNLINIFGEKNSATFIASLRLRSWGFNKSYLNPLKEIPSDAEYYFYYKITDILREKLPGNQNVKEWADKNLNKLHRVNSILCCSAILAVVIVFFVWVSIEEGLLSDLLLYFNLTIIPIVVSLFLLINWLKILRFIDNKWYSALMVSLLLIYFDYVIFLVLNIFFYDALISLPFDIFLLLYITRWPLWGLTIVLYRSFRKNALYGQRKITSGSVFFYVSSSIYLFGSILLFLTDWMGSVDVYSFQFFWEHYFLIFFLTVFTSYVLNLNNEGLFNTGIWIRRKFIKPIEIYDSIGIFDEFIQAIADVTNSDIKEIATKIDKSKTIEENYRNFGVKFKGDINKAFDVISKHKREIFNIILPKCPDNKVCAILNKKMEEFGNIVDENFSLTHINYNSIGLSVYDRLPNNIREALRRAEKFFRMLKLYNEESYGASVIELAKSFEGLFKILLNEFKSHKSFSNCLHQISYDSRIEKELDIVDLIKHGTDGFSFGRILKLIDETYSFPDVLEIKSKFLEFFDKKLPIKIDVIKTLRKITNYRNEYAHIAGEIITSEQYIKYRDLIFNIFNELLVDLSEISLHDLSAPKVKVAQLA